MAGAAPYHTHDTVSLCPTTPEYEAFLFRVYANTRAQEMALLNWEDAERDAFLQMQFAAQHRYYHEQFSAASFDLVLQNGEPIGRLYVDRRVDEIRIVDIALLQQYRSKGVGSALL